MESCTFGFLLEFFVTSFRVALYGFFMFLCFFSVDELLLTPRAGKGSASSSSSSESDGAALDALKSQLEEEKASVASLQLQNAELQGLQV
jgi:hypothetical protein